MSDISRVSGVSGLPQAVIYNNPSRGENSTVEVVYRRKRYGRKSTGGVDKIYGGCGKNGEGVACDQWIIPIHGSLFVLVTRRA